MKVKLTIGLCLLSVIVFAQKKGDEIAVPKLPKDAETKLITWEGVVDVPGASQKELYNRAYAFVQGYYKNPADVLREKDPVAGSMKCKARFKIYTPPDKKGFTADAGDVMYTLNLQFKDGKYRYVISEYNWKQSSYYACEKWEDTSSSSYQPQFPYYLKQLDEKTTEILVALKKSMTSAGDKKKSDW